ncbi:MAG TPA: hypothetical protein PLT65_04520 [Bacilli bacterium]|nr:hypothetical protein [Bacilli bacterium]
MSWGWFSSNEEGKVVAKTDVHDDGSVHRYDYTKEDDISAGHGHTKYDNMNDFMNGKSSWSRGKNDSGSAGRGWKGNGFNLNIDDMDFLDENELMVRSEEIRKSAVFSYDDLMILKLTKR